MSRGILLINERTKRVGSFSGGIRFGYGQNGERAGRAEEGDQEGDE